MLFKNTNQRNYISRNTYHSYAFTQKIKNIINGNMGEMYAIFTNLYQSFIVEDENLRETLIKIVEDKINNVQKLSHILVDAKVLPIFTDAQNVFFSTQKVNYETNSSVFIKQNYDIQKSLVKEFLSVLDEIEDSKIKEEMADIVKTEKDILEIYKRFLGEFLKD